LQCVHTSIENIVYVALYLVLNFFYFKLKYMCSSIYGVSYTLLHTVKIFTYAYIHLTTNNQI
jgi:CTP:phosphocholine cytidylyltransferase-like protein